MNLLKRYLQLNIKYFRYKCIKSHRAINGLGYTADLQCLDIEHFHRFLHYLSKPIKNGTILIIPEKFFKDCRGNIEDQGIIFKEYIDHGWIKINESNS